MAKGKLFILMFVMLFLVGTVSALEWDNIKSYDETTKTVTIENSVLKLIPTSTIAEVKLITPLNHKVPIGYQKVAEFEIKGYINYTETLKELELYEANDLSKEIVRSYDYKYKSTENVEVNDYGHVCTLNKLNNSEDCNYEVVGTHFEEKEVWLDFDGNIKTNDVINIGIFTNVEIGDHVEWILNIMGIRVEEWAEWTASLNVGLEVYYNFDASSGTVLDEQVSHVKNGTNINMDNTNWVAGILGNSLNFDGTNEIVNITDGTGFWDSSTTTISFWIYPETNYTTTQYFWDGIGNRNYHLIQGPTNAWDIRMGGTTAIYPTGQNINVSSVDPWWTLNNWHHIVFIHDGSGNNEFWADGVNYVNSTVTWSPADTTSIYMGSRYTSADFFDGRMDEFGVWNRTLSGSEVLQLYNGGTGITYSTDLDTAPTITHNSPVNEFNSTSSIITFNKTVSDDINLINVTLYIDGVLNETNSSGINNSFYTFIKTFTDGSYNWTYEACDNASKCTTAPTLNFTIDTTPNITFETPTTLANNTNHTGNYIPVNVSLTETYFDNVTFNFYNGSLTSYVYSDSTRSINETFADDTYYYNATVWTTTSQTNSTNTRWITIDTTSPIIPSTTNLTNLTTFSFPINSTWSFNVSEANPHTCWYNNVTGGTNYTVTCNSTINTTWGTEGWKDLQYCVNDTHGFETCNQSEIYIYSITDLQTDTPDPVGEGVNVVYTLQVNLTNTPSADATLLLNNTYYSATKTSYTDYTEFTRTITIPNTWGSATGNNINWSWNYTITGVTTNHTTSITNTTVYELAIDDCSTYGDPILNLSLKDEEANTLVNGSAGSTIELDLRLTSLIDPTIYVDYNNTWTNVNESAVCIPSSLLTNSDYQIDFTIGYTATDKVWEFFYLDGGTLNSTKVFDAYTDNTIDLMDLITTDSTSFLFNFFDVDGLPVDASIVHVFRKYIGEGLFREIERGKADENGDTTLHLVEEDVIYYFVVTENGATTYTSSEYTALCQEVPCNIQLEASGDSAEFSTNYDLVTEGNFTINSSTTSRLVSLVYDMESATKYNFTLYKYESDGSYSSIASGEETGTEGIITLAVPLSAGNVSFFSTVYESDEFITSEWVDFSDRTADYFGTTLSLFLAGLIILTLSLVAVSEGAGVIIFTIIGVLVSGALGLITVKLSTGLSVLVYLIIAGGLIIWKLTGGRK